MIRNLALATGIALMMLSCEEVPPYINPGSGGNPNQPNGERRVLVEEFTGVRCVNCPAGTDAIQTLKGIYDEQLIAVSIHTGFFAPPYPESTQDFRIAQGASILSYLGEPLGYPTAVVNRKQFSGETDLQLGQSQWAGFIAEELAIAPAAEVGIVKVYNPNSRAVQVQIDLEILETIAENDVRLSVMLTEDKVVDMQLTPSGKKSDYLHRHVLRGMMTAYDGELIPGPLEAGDELMRTFTYTLPVGWNADNCHIVAFLHHSGSTKTVIQANEATVTN